MRKQNLRVGEVSTSDSIPNGFFGPFCPTFQNGWIRPWCYQPMNGLAADLVFSEIYGR